MLSPEEFARLQKLSCLSLSPEETQKLSSQISSIVGFLGALSNIAIDNDVQQQALAPDWDHGLAITAEMVHYDTPDALFDNVQHEKLNRSIVIKSVVEE